MSLHPISRSSVPASQKIPAKGLWAWGGSGGAVRTSLAFTMAEELEFTLSSMPTKMNNVALLKNALSDRALGKLIQMVLGQKRVPNPQVYAEGVIDVHRLGGSILCWLCRGQFMSTWWTSTVTSLVLKCNASTRYREAWQPAYWYSSYYSWLLWGQIVFVKDWCEAAKKNTINTDTDICQSLADNLNLISHKFLAE